MRGHAWHLTIAVIVAWVLLSIATEAARAQDFVGHSGAQLYGRFCASCHGFKGYGDGPVAASLKITVPDLVRLAQRHGGVFPEEQVRKIIDGRTNLPPHGTRVMPVWGFEFNVQNVDKPDPQRRTEEMVARLTEYLRTLQRP
jgi:mono/diheme cytochrome c family protein